MKKHRRVWEYDSAYTADRLDALLEAGWEPFAVTVAHEWEAEYSTHNLSSVTTYHLRRKV